MRKEVYALRKYSISIIYYILSTFGVSLTLVANIGVGSINALAMGVSSITAIQVGTVLMAINVLFWVISVSIDPQRRLVDYVLMALAAFSFGMFVNFFMYQLFKDVHLTSYASRFAVYFIGTIIVACCIGRLLAYGVLKFPIECCCELWEAKTRGSFMHYRYAIDFISIVASLALSLLFGLDFFVREGTILNFVLFPFLVTQAKKIPIKE